jgi:hypothetical protein
MRIAKFMIAAAAASIAVAPAMAAPANPASSLSVSKSVRQGTDSSKKSRLAAVGIMPLLIGVGIVAGTTYLVVDHEDKNDDADSN